MGLLLRRDKPASTRVVFMNLEWSSIGVGFDIGVGSDIGVGLDIRVIWIGTCGA